MSKFSQYCGTRRRQRLVLLGVACLALQAIIPVGYMPGNLLAGEFMELCPTGLPAGIAQSIHQDHGDHEQNVLDADQTCPIGSALQPAGLPQDAIQVSVVRLPVAHATKYRYQSVTADRVRQYHSRAPPRA